jgi:predicted MPP superfamily phosphohydrolase
MTIVTSIILVVAIVAIAAFIAYNMQRGTKAMSEFKADYDNNAEVQEVVELAKELYNKDLRPIVSKKEPLTKKSKEKIIKSITNTGEYVAPEKPKKKRKYYPKKKKTQE